MPDLSKKRVRDRLKIRRDPHYQTMGKGQSLGFRRGPDTWTARFRDKGQKQRYTALKSIAPNDYDGARKAALAWFEGLGGTAVRSAKRETVKAALEAYVSYLRRQGRSKSASDAEQRFALTAYKDAIADIPLEDASREDFEEFRERLIPGRKPRSVNRQYRAITAGLNRAHKLGHVGNPAAWTLEPLHDEVEDDGETAIFLDASQRKALIGAADRFAGDFFRGLELTGARPGELAACVVRDFDGASLKLSHRKGRPPKLRVRRTVLGPDGVAFFAARCADRIAAAPIFTEDGETPWRRHVWARAIRAASEKVNESAKGSARIPPGVGAYCFRHARISELLQIYGVDPLTVAAQCGTSLAMIEKAYLKFIAPALQEKLASLKERA